MSEEVQQLKVGRGHLNDIVVSHPSVSSIHCVISREGSAWRIKDLDSRNGTYVNGVKVLTSSLRDGDSVLLGLAQFRFSDSTLKYLGPHSFPSESTQVVDNKPPHRYLRLPIWISGALALVAVLLVAVLLAGTRNGGDQAVGEPVPADLFSAPPNLSEVIDIVRESVLGVECGDSQGTGWVLSLADRSWIVTNHHVVSECLNRGSVSLLFGESRRSGSVAASDSDTDLAVISAELPVPGLATSSPPDIGSWVMIIGNPLGLDRSVNYGSVTNAAEGFLITDAAINPGNSGGPVFNSLGEVVGVASAKLVADGIDRIGLVIPLANLCEQVLECEVGQWER